MRISDWSSDVCSSELVRVPGGGKRTGLRLAVTDDAGDHDVRVVERRSEGVGQRVAELSALVDRTRHLRRDVARDAAGEGERSEEHTSELQSLMRISYAVFCLKKKNKTHNDT